ncbi:DNA repair protein [Sphaerosporella brunnea]|uniref:DNA repair protein n=1 Tax=Sphaerosporella brunnea TaxID=1250544 RepID=A0A5J5F4G4_9PEZI|nr:DNA repair protein [Sphaerosporella brunnea]
MSSPSVSAREKKLTKLAASNAALTAELAGLREALAGESQKLTNPEGAGVDTVRHHIALLHEYNEVKDVALGLLALVAEARGVTLASVAAEFGVQVGE